MVFHSNTTIKYASFQLASINYESLYFVVSSKSIIQMNTQTDTLFSSARSLKGLGKIIMFHVINFITILSTLQKLSLSTKIVLIPSFITVHQIT